MLRSQSSCVVVQGIERFGIPAKGAAWGWNPAGNGTCSRGEGWASLEEAGPWPWSCFCPGDVSSNLHKRCPLD